MSDQEVFNPETLATIVALLREHVPEFKDCEAPEVERMKVPSANKIVLVTNPSNSSKVVVKCPLVNPFCEIFDLSEQCDVNNMITKFRGNLGLNPIVYYCDDSYRIEQFVIATSVKYEDYSNSELMKQLAEIICEFHHNSELKQKYIDLRGENTFRIRLEGVRKILQDKFQERRKTISKDIPEEHQEGFSTLYEKLEKLIMDDEYYKKVTDYLFQDEQKLGQIVSHNDPSCNNILKITDPETSKVTLQLIDFDSANLSHAGCDIGYIIRASGYNYTTFYLNPDDMWKEDKRKEFITFYLTKLHEISSSKTTLEDFINENLPLYLASASRGLAVAHYFMILLAVAPTGYVLYSWLGFHRVKDHLFMMEEFTRIISEGGF